MHPLLKICILALTVIGVFCAVLALVERLQKHKKRNVPSLDPGPDESQNAELGGTVD